MKAKSIALLVYISLFTACTLKIQKSEISEEKKPDIFSKGNLKISLNNRFIQFEDGTPFFWLGDTAWTIFHRLNIDEADEYFKDRSSKGFTLVQSSILGVGAIQGLGTSHNIVNGEKPLIEDNPEKPNEAFFKHVDNVIKKAETYGLFVGLLPAWGEYVCPAWHDGPKIFDKDNAKIYGVWLGNRYKDNPNIIWIIGGDRTGDHCGSDDIEIWRSLAYGIKSVDSNHLMTYHPCGKHSSSETFHSDTWLDFNMYESTKATESITEMTKTDYDKESPIKPVVNGEPYYYGSAPPEEDRIMRSQSYWTILSGGAGFTFGQKFVWGLCKNDNFNNGFYDCDEYWYNYMDTNGTKWIQYFKNIFTSFEWWNLIPNQSIILSGEGSGNNKKSSAMFIKEDRMIIYFATNSEAKIDLSKITVSNLLSSYWWNPKDQSKTSSVNIDNKTDITLSPPDGWEDGLLIVESRI